MVQITELDRLDDVADDDQVEEDPPPEEEVDFNTQVDNARLAMQPTPFEKFMAICKSLLLRAMVIYFVMTFIRSNSSTTPSQKTPTTTRAVPNAFSNGTEFELYIYINENSLKINDHDLVWKVGIVYGQWEDVVFETEFALGEGALSNGSFFIHAVVVPRGGDPLKDQRIYLSKMLNKYKKKKQVLRNLLEEKNVEEPPPHPLSHYHPNLTLNLVQDWTFWTPGSVPSPLNNYVNFIEDAYLPVLFFNDYWNLAKDYQVITNNRTLPLTLTYTPLSLFKWQLYAAQSMRSQWSLSSLTGEEESDSDQDTLKEAIIDTNPVLLGLTFVVSLLHSVFEFLAFKNDIQFWNNRKSLEGLSVRSVFFNVFQSTIVLLYVLDNETNWVIRVSCAVGLAIEVWKINKVTDVALTRTNNFPYFFTFKSKPSYTSLTSSYDKLAFHYLSWLCFPLFIAYSIYSLLYNEHKGVYSFFLSLSYGFLLTFGFIMMTPQLFINYKLKSVAHLPWRMLTYKFLNTFIDDVFAFVIKMPWMYRIGCLRDDVVFFVYLWQRWVYRVDFKRVNEFGYGGENEEVVGVVGEEDKKEK